MISRKTKPVADWHWNHWNLGRAILEKGSEQRNKLLMDAVASARLKADTIPYFRGTPSLGADRVVGGVILHVEGGRAYDRHARRLVREGYLRIERRAIKQSSFGGGIIRWSVLVPTQKGFEAAASIK